MKVDAVTVATAALVGLVVGAFATGRVGGVVLPLLFVLACPLIMMFTMASTSDGHDAEGTPDPRGRRAGKRDDEDAGASGSRSRG